MTTPTQNLEPQGAAGDTQAGTPRFARRSFLTLALAALFVHGFRIPLGAKAAAPFNAGDFWRHEGSARAVGERYLALMPQERDQALLRRALFGSGASGRSPSPEALRLQISALRERDFTTGDTVMIDGWMMARSEARLCAMTALG